MAQQNGSAVEMVTMSAQLQVRLQKVQKLYRRWSNRAQAFLARQSHVKVTEVEEEQQVEEVEEVEEEVVEQVEQVEQVKQVEQMEQVEQVEKVKKVEKVEQVELGRLQPIC
jgi:hypothetical protein